MWRYWDGRCRSIEVLQGELSQVLVASVRECAHALYTPAAHMLH